MWVLEWREIHQFFYYCKSLMIVALSPLNFTFFLGYDLILTNAYHSHYQSGHRDLTSPWIPFQCFQDILHAVLQASPRGWHAHDGLKMFCWAPWNPNMTDQHPSSSMVRTVTHSSIDPFIHPSMLQLPNKYQPCIRHGLGGWGHKDKDLEYLPSGTPNKTR